MKVNVGIADSMFRMCLGLIIAVAGMITESYWGVFAFIPFISGAIGFSPLYWIFHINTTGKSWMK